MIDIIDDLEMFKPVQGDGYVDLTLPVALDFAFSLIELRITPHEDTYTIELPFDIFYDTNGDADFYIDIFERHDKNCHYGIAVKDGVICKEYQNDYNPTRAIDQFIRYFIYLDDFLIKNDVIGHEEDFQ